MEEGRHVPEAYRANKDLAISNISRAAEMGSREVLEDFHSKLFCFLTHKRISQQHNNQWVYSLHFEASRKQVRPTVKFHQMYQLLISEKHRQGALFQTTAWQ